MFTIEIGTNFAQTHATYELHQHVHIPNQRLHTYILSPLLATASFAFCVIPFEPIEFQTCSVPQNDRLNLIFVKDIYLNSGKLARNGRKTAIYHFVSNQVQKIYSCMSLYIFRLCANFWGIFKPWGWRNFHNWQSAHLEILYFHFVS